MANKKDQKRHSSGNKNGRKGSSSSSAHAETSDPGGDVAVLTSERSDAAASHNGQAAPSEPKPKMSRKEFEKEVKKLQVELVKLQEWVKATGAKIVVVFEGRDTAGKGLRSLPVSEI